MRRCQCILKSGPDKGSQCRYKAKLNTQFCSFHRGCTDVMSTIRPRAPLPVLPIDMIDQIMRQSDIDDVLRMCQTNKEIRAYCLSGESELLFMHLRDRNMLPSTVNTYLSFLDWRNSKVLIPDKYLPNIMPVLVEMLYHCYDIIHDLPDQLREVGTSLSLLVPRNVLGIYEQKIVGHEDDDQEEDDDVHDPMYDEELGYYLYRYGMDFDPKPRRKDFPITVYQSHHLPGEIDFENNEDREDKGLNMTFEVKLSANEADILRRIAQRLNEELIAYIDFESNIKLKYSDDFPALNEDPRGTTLADWILGYTQSAYIFRPHTSSRDLAQYLYELKSHKFDTHYELFTGVKITNEQGVTTVNVEFDHGS